MISYAFVDRQELAIDWRDKLLERGYVQYPYIATHGKIYRMLDANPRFQGVLGRIKTAWEQFDT